MIKKKTLEHILEQMEFNLLTVRNELLTTDLGTKHYINNDSRLYLEKKITKEKFYIDWIRVEMKGKKHSDH